jgi:hypothetical protein
VAFKVLLYAWRQQKAGIMPALLLLSRLHNSSQMMPREQHRNTAARMSLPNTHSLGVLSLTENKKAGKERLLLFPHRQFIFSVVANERTKKKLLLFKKSHIQELNHADESIG